MKTSSGKSNGKAGLPNVRHVLNLWSLVRYPNAKKEWPLDKKMAAVKEAGFDGITTVLTPEHTALAEKNNLYVVGFFSSATPSEFGDWLKKQQDCGAKYINAQLGDHDTPVEDAIKMAIKLIEEGKKIGVEPSFEVHRDTATETPEKTYAIADGFKQATGELLPMTFDYSHLAIIKHLHPPFYERLLDHPDLVQRANQFHLRPFNGHHCQVPVTDGKGKLTPEIKDWFLFAEKLFEQILEGGDPQRELFFVPEMGPYGGYNLSVCPSSWEDAVVLRGHIAKMWKKALSNAKG